MCTMCSRYALMCVCGVFTHVHMCTVTCDLVTPCA